MMTVAITPSNSGLRLGTWVTTNQTGHIGYTSDWCWAARRTFFRPLNAPNTERQHLIQFAREILSTAVSFARWTRNTSTQPYKRRVYVKTTFIRELRRQMMEEAEDSLEKEQKVYRDRLVRLPPRKPVPLSTGNGER